MPVYKSLQFLGYPKYRVGDDGTVWALRSRPVPGEKWKRRMAWKRLKPNAGRYLQVWLSENKRRRIFHVHYLVLVAFVGPRPDGCVARHFPDRSPYNNARSNLSWATEKVNQGDRLSHDTHSRGERHGNAKLTRTDVTLMGDLREQDRKFWTWARLAARFNVSLSAAHAAVKGNNWRHLRGETATQG